MKRLFLLLCCVFTLISCDTKNKCEDVMCTSPIPFVKLNIVNFDSGENVFASGIFNVENVKLFKEDNEPIPVWLDSENKLESAIGDIIGNNKYSLFLSPIREIKITAQVAPAKEDCCSSSNIVSFNIVNYDFVETSKRNYTIFIKFNN